VEEIVNIAAIALVDAGKEVALDAELKADKRQRMRGMRMRPVLRFNIANRERGKRNWERQLRAEGRRGASLSWWETS
jgi:predicted membrane GTPase involved in stress response